MNMNTPSHPAPRSALRRRLALGAAAALALVAGGIGAAKAVEHQHGMWLMQDGIPVERIEQRADRLLGKVAATPEQQAKVHAIIEAAAKDLEPLRANMQGTRAQVADLLTAPGINRDAIEHLRAERIGAMDQASQRISHAVADIAEVLTPEQRAKLKSVMEQWQPHHG